MAALEALAAPVERGPIAALAVLAAVVVPGRAARVVLVLRASAARAAVAALAVPAGMQVVSPMAPLVVVLALVALAARVALQAQRARTPHRLSVVLAGPVGTPELLVLARQVSTAWMEHPFHATAALEALAALVEREPIAALAAPVAVALLGRATLVVWVLRAPAARAAVAARAVPAGMQVV
jgi:hypothetical protein